ncbi:MAG: hypothetical protein ACRDDZ_05950 [Marinifilaceae bacterium]
MGKINWMAPILSKLEKGECVMLRDLLDVVGVLKYFLDKYYIAYDVSYSYNNGFILIAANNLIKIEDMVPQKNSINWTREIKQNTEAHKVLAQVKDVEKQMKQARRQVVTPMAKGVRISYVKG